MRPAAEEDHYTVLGVAAGATAAEIRRAFRQLALRHHPDRAGPDSTARFQRIAFAYRVLSNPDARLAYDRHPTRAASAAAAANPGAHGGPGAPNRAAPPAVPRTDDDPRVPRWSPAPQPQPGIPDLIERLAAPLPALIERGAARPLPDGSVELLLTADEAQAGGTAALGVDLRVPCPTCGGCAQPGSIWCMRCEFDGTIPELVTVCIAIPPAVADGATFTVRVDPMDAAPPLRLRIRR